MQIITSVEEIVSEILDLRRPIEADEDLRDLGLDSMKCINLIVRIEDHFNIIFNNQEFKINHFRTIRTIDALLCNKINLTST